MVLEIRLSPKAEARLKAAARQKGISVQEYAEQVLDEVLLPIEDENAASICLLNSWLQEESRG